MNYHHQTMILVEFSIPKNIIETIWRNCINSDLDQRNSSQERVRKWLFSAQFTLEVSEAKVYVMPRQVGKLISSANFIIHVVCQTKVEVNGKQISKISCEEKKITIIIDGILVKLRSLLWCMGYLIKSMNKL